MKQRQLLFFVNTFLALRLPFISDLESDACCSDVCTMQPLDDPSTILGFLCTDPAHLCSYQAGSHLFIAAAVVVATPAGEVIYIQFTVAIDGKSREQKEHK